MKILHFVPNISLKSGIINMIMNYYRELQVEGKDDTVFDFVFFEKGPDKFFENEIKSYGGKVFLICKPSLNTAFFRDWNSFCTKHYGDYDILHIHLPFLNFLFHNAKKKLGVKKIISHAHVTQLGDKTQTRIRNRIMYTFGAGVPDNQFACSEKAGEVIFGQVFSKSGRVVNNAINVEKFVFNPRVRVKIRQQLGLQDKFVVGHIGRFATQKNHEFLVDVFDSFVKNHQNSVLMLVGEGPLEKSVKEKVANLGLTDKVLFLGQRKDVNEIVQAFDYFLFPSHYEGLGITLIEAQASGVPCLISDTIPDETHILPTTKVLSLSESPSTWAHMFDFKCKRYTSAVDFVNKSGFNIKLEAVKLLQDYQDVLKDGS